MFQKNVIAREIQITQMIVNVNERLVSKKQILFRALNINAFLRRIYPKNCQNSQNKFQRISENKFL